MPPIDATNSFEVSEKRQLNPIERFLNVPFQMGRGPQFEAFRLSRSDGVPENAPPRMQLRLLLQDPIESADHASSDSSYTVAFQSSKESPHPACTQLAHNLHTMCGQSSGFTLHISPLMGPVTGSSGLRQQIGPSAKGANLCLGANCHDPN